jgi:hypothetical protein
MTAFLVVYAVVLLLLLSIIKAAEIARAQNQKRERRSTNSKGTMTSTTDDFLYEEKIIYKFASCPRHYSRRLLAS